MVANAHQRATACAMAFRELATRARGHRWISRCMSTVERAKDVWWSEEKSPTAASLRVEIERRFQQDLPPGA